MAAGRSHVDFAIAVASWLDRQRSAHTRDAYGRDLERFLEWWTANRAGSPLDATTADLQAYRAHIAGQDLAAATVDRRLASMGSFFAHAVTQGVIDDVPEVPAAAADADPPVLRELTPAEIEQLMVAAMALGGRHLVLFTLLLFDKQRLGDILGYDVEDIRISRTGAVVTSASGEQWRTDARTTAALRPHLAGRAAGPLLTAQRGERRLSRFGADFLLRQISEAAGVHPTVSANGLRRTPIEPDG